MLIVHTKLTPPRLPKRVLDRPRLTARLLEALDHRLTIVHAEAGYGKSTALAALAGAGQQLAWYHMDAEDAEPLVFIHHLVHSVREAIPDLSEAPLAALEAWEGGGGQVLWSTAVDLLVNELDQLLTEPLLLVLDDAHHLAQSPQILLALDRLIGRAPYDLHVVLATRVPILLPTRITWRARGEMMEIGRDELAFTADEVEALFAGQDGIKLAPEEVSRLTAETEGWAIALQLVWQGLRVDRQSVDNQAILSRALVQRSATAADLFGYLAQEVFAQQPVAILAFLRQTAVLRELAPAVCECLMSQQATVEGEMDDAAAILRHLQDHGLFVVVLGNGHARYHHLFRGFLLDQLTPAETTIAHRQAAACYRRLGDLEGALHHLMAAQSWEEAAGLLRALGQGMVRAGRLDTLAGWINSLPPDVLEHHPPLMAYLGDVARLHSRFNEALSWYKQAESHSRGQGDTHGVGQALRGQARVYLDTVNPSQAEHLLQEALRLSEGQEDRETRIRLLELLAENRLNLGRLDDAEQFQEQAKALREEMSSEAELAVRVLIRTGRLAEARAILEERADAEQRSPVLRPRAHRETLLLLALVLAFQGEGDAAHRCALDGTARGQALGSPFITAVGLMRQGHAWHVQAESAADSHASQCFREAIEIADSLAVPRLKVEAFWGLCRAQGFHGNIAAAEEAAAQGLAIARLTGDEWIMALIRLALAAAYAEAGRTGDATPLLVEAAAAFRECSDTFGETATRLWQCLLWQTTGDRVRLERGLDELLRSAREHGYDFLLLQRTLLGPPEPRRIVPLLLFARTANRQRAYAESLLNRLGLGKLELHPGYPLRVQTLGAFQVWRGAHEISTQEWRRDKARQLFQVLLTYRHRLLERDQILDMLWPSLNRESAESNFKVALNTLYRVLEPELPARSPSAYVLRDNTLYGLRPTADLWLDAAEFERMVVDGDRRFEQRIDSGLDSYRQALEGYRGDYLQDYPYDDWCSEERERLLGLYLHAADRLAGKMAERGRWQETIDTCQAILQRDECWEQAYRLLMLAHARLGNRAQALRTYQRCVERLREELDVSPSAATVLVFEELKI